MAAKTTKSTMSPKPGQVFGKNGVLYTFPEGDGGPVNINIDFALAPAPSSYYYADAIVLNTDDDLLMEHLSFGRRKRDTTEFEDRIDIVMPAASLRQFRTSSREVEAAVDLMLVQLGATSRIMKPIAAADSIAMTLFANMIFMAVGQGESSLDFYHLSPRDVHLAKTKKIDMQISPIVRVILSSVLTKYFFGLIERRSQVGQSSELFTEGRERATGRR